MASSLEIVLVLLTLGAAAVGIANVERSRARVGLFVGLLVVTAGSLAAFVRRAEPAPLARERPTPAPRSSYVSSATCRGCHPSEHASFGRTYHRTMTQDATIHTVLAPLTRDGGATELDGHRLRLEARGEAVWATLPDPDATPSAPSATGSLRDVPDVERRVVLTTGSHREQAYWVGGKRAGELRLFPLVWVVAEQRFVPRRDAFLSPPDEPLPKVRWNSNCIACHAVAGEPGHSLQTDAFTTRAAELGIACEACHGPGAAHVERHRDPFERYAQHSLHTEGKRDPTIVHPARLSPERSAAICGQCHAYAFPRDEDTFWTSGYAKAFRAGDALEPSRFVLSPDLLRADEDAEANDDAQAGRARRAVPHIEAELDSLFWPDGSIRVGGREYNGLVASPCYERGSGERKMTCLSCHAMHRGEPAGQIAPNRTDDAACTQCHEAERARSHAHHAAGSPGSACVDCHMPRTSYALFSGVRSHRIDAPSVESTLRTGKPNACNLCHLDRSLEWTATQLSAWFGTPKVEVPAERATTAEGLYLALTGDAAQRVLVADALGRPESRAAMGDDVQAPLLRELRTDPYAAIRFVAERSTRALEPTAGAAPQRATRPNADERAALGFRSDGGIDPERAARLRERRDDRPLRIAE